MLARFYGPAGVYIDGCFPILPWCGALKATWDHEFQRGNKIKARGKGTMSKCLFRILSFLRISTLGMNSTSFCSSWHCCCCNRKQHSPCCNRKWSLWSGRLSPWQKCKFGITELQFWVASSVGNSYARAEEKQSRHTTRTSHGSDAGEMEPHCKISGWSYPISWRVCSYNSFHILETLAVVMQPWLFDRI